MSKVCSSRRHSETQLSSAKQAHGVALMGWAVVIGSVMAVSACDDSKDVCLKSCSKMEECMPADLKSAKKPSGSWEDAPAGKKAQALAEEIDGKLEEGADFLVGRCKADCEGDLSGAKKQDMAKLKACLDKDCEAYMKCVSRE